MPAALFLAALLTSQPRVAPPALEQAPMPKGMAGAFPGQAVVIILVPADAELYINRCYVRGAGDRRVFITPPLFPEATFFYDLRVHVVRDSRTFTDFRRVTFRAGDVVEADLSDFPPVPTVGVRGR